MKGKIVMEKTVLVTGIGGLTPRSITGIIRENHPDYKIIGCDIEKKAMGFFMKGLLDEYYVCPRCTDSEYFTWIEKLVESKHIDYAFVQPESEIVEWGAYYEKNGRFPCPVFMGSKLLSESLRDKSIMADLLEGTDFIPKTIKVTQENPRFEDVENEIGFPCWIRATEGTTHFARFLNEDRINKFCDECIKYLEKKLGVPAHGILSFDLKEDKNGKMKVTEINIRHMAYAGVMAHVGFDLIEDTIRIMEDGNCNNVVRDQYHHYDKPYIFLRDVDVEPIILESEEIFDDPKVYFNIK